MHVDAALRERHRDPAGADAELERIAVAGEVGEEVDGRLDDRRVELLAGRLVVPLGDALAEVVLGHEESLVLAPPEASAADEDRRAGGTVREQVAEIGL